MTDPVVFLSQELQKLLGQIGVAKQLGSFFPKLVFEVAQKRRSSIPGFTMDREWWQSLE